MSGVKAIDGRRLPWFQVTKAETARLVAIAEPRMLPYLRSMYFALLELANDQRADEVPVSRSELALRAGVSTATIKRLTPVLADGGLVRVDENPGYASVWTVLGVGSDRPGGVGSDSTGGSGLGDPGVGSGGPALKDTGQEVEKTKRESPKDSRDRDGVWAHYQATMPNGERCQLNAARKLLIDNALRVRSVEECKLAITGLSRSSYHVDNGYLDLKYALLGGGRSPSIEATIDRLVSVANGTVNGHANGNGNGRAVGILERQIWPDGRSWPQLTRGEQENAKDRMAMGDPTPWLEREVVASAHINGNGGGRVWTAENIGEADDDLQS